MIERSKVVEVARTFVGTRFLINGRNPAGGIDCGGLLLLVAAQVGAHYRDVSKRYTEFPTRSDERLRHLREHMQEVPLEALAPGMVLGLWALRAGIVQHLAIWSGPGPDGDGRMIHAWDEAGEVRESRVGKYWRSRIVGVFDWKEASTPLPAPT